MKALRATILISKTDNPIMPPITQFDLFGDTLDEIFDEFYDLGLNTNVRNDIAKIVVGSRELDVPYKYRMQDNS